MDPAVEKIIEYVIKQMEDDIEYGEYEAIAELLSFCPVENLLGYINEEVAEELRQEL